MNGKRNRQNLGVSVSNVDLRQSDGSDGVAGADDTSQIGFIKRTFSFQFGRRAFKLDAQTSAMIKMRYKDVSKFVIWPDCSLPKDYNNDYLTFDSNKVKQTKIRYNHAGNHQAALLRLKTGQMDSVRNMEHVARELPKTVPRTKPQNSYHAHPVQTMFDPSLSTVEEEKSERQSNIMDGRNQWKASMQEIVIDDCRTLVDIEDDKTPEPKRIINEIRRSDSSDEDEPVNSMTSLLNAERHQLLPQAQSVRVWRF